ncbi:MAG: hypothetical protein A2277_08320 [Desulfobacterales bacterium RIFOXYA12_FULL_46_15]|nr:MAG: hypothetical protein A2097_02530 [Desulfobacula sp. GWF2_41_7]OGR25243.1 MAG: hypothetical protein A2277_08320 [Desulfobacterales bacterium RIFOXYA12_FULL_46_15]
MKDFSGPAEYHVKSLSLNYQGSAFVDFLFNITGWAEMIEREQKFSAIQTSFFAIKNKINDTDQSFST